MIARALAQDAELLLVNEPTSHLDVLHKFNIFGLFHCLVHITKKCSILVVNEVELALKNSDCLWVIH
ncbi:MAG: hypothetical protein ABI045_05950 [Flavobacteriales bacterium]